MVDFGTNFPAIYVQLDRVVERALSPFRKAWAFFILPCVSHAKVFSHVSFLLLAGVYSFHLIKREIGVKKDSWMTLSLCKLEDRKSS